MSGGVSPGPFCVPNSSVRLESVSSVPKVSTRRQHVCMRQALAFFWPLSLRLASVGVVLLQFTVDLASCSVAVDFAHLLRWEVEVCQCIWLFWPNIRLKETQALVHQNMIWTLQSQEPEGHRRHLYGHCLGHPPLSLRHWGHPAHFRPKRAPETPLRASSVCTV